jgi:hypothetical protein
MSHIAIPAGGFSLTMRSAESVALRRMSHYGAARDALWGIAVREDPGHRGHIIQPRHGMDTLPEVMIPRFTGIPYRIDRTRWSRPCGPYAGRKPGGNLRGEEFSGKASVISYSFGRNSLHRSVGSDLL